MKSILCYGDSNTWGYDPATGMRFGRDIRWTGILQNCLGSDYYVIEEGLNGRNTIWPDPIKEFKNGKAYLIPCLESHKPIDLVILMLGTNDLKKYYNLTPADIAQGIGLIIEMIQKSGCGINGSAPEILLLVPPLIEEIDDLIERDTYEGGFAKSRLFNKYYERVAQQYNCSLLNTSEIIATSHVDGIHIEPSEHKKLGIKLSEIVKNLLNN